MLSRTRMNDIAMLAVATVLAAPLAGCDRHRVVDWGKYQALRPGMTLDTVTRLIGSPGRQLHPGEEIEGGLVPDKPGEAVYAWINPDGSNVTIAFRNDHVVATASSRLKWPAL